jgi:uncharacterized protein (DUF488 family)
MTGTVQTLGYMHPDAATTLAAWMASDPMTVLVDIRYSPRSRWRPQWTKKALEAAYGGRYIHVKAFGNVNYRDPVAPIRLLDPDAGVRWALKTLHAGYSLILLCACKEDDRCHRKTVATLIEQALEPPPQG